MKFNSFQLKKGHAEIASDFKSNCCHSGDIFYKWKKVPFPKATTQSETISKVGTALSKLT